MVSTPTHDRPEPAGFGAALRAARTASQLSLADLERRTKIRAGHLAALEEERLDLLPPLPFVRGFIRRIAEEVGIDPEPLVARLAETAAGQAGVTGEVFRPVQAPIEPAQDDSAGRRTRSIAVVALLVAAALIVYLTLQVIELGRPEQVAPPGPAPLPTPVAVAAPEPTPSPAPVTPTVIVVELTATGRSWLQVATEKETVFEGFIGAGELRRWESTSAITIRVGNAGAVAVTVNGKAIGSIGGPGEVVSRTFRRETGP